jgi:hypothetical protein
VTTERLQLTLIPDLRPAAQPLPLEVRARTIELIATMLLRLVRPNRNAAESLEVRDESR